MGFDFSHFQVWVILEENKGEHVKICVSRLFTLFCFFLKIWSSEFLKSKMITQAECFSWRLKEAASAAKMFTTVWESAGQSELDVIISKLQLNALSYASTPIHHGLQKSSASITVPNRDIHGQIILKKKRQKNVWIA